MKKTAKLLGETLKPLTYKIFMVLSDNETAEFHYSDQMAAESHYLQLSGMMNLGGLAIKKIRLDKLDD